MRVVAVALVVLGVTFGTSEAGLADAGDAKNRPVTKVINLLKDMIAQLEKEGEEDEEVYETMGCWCETGDKEKTKAIADANSRIGSLSATIEELTGESAQLNTEIANLNTEVKKDQEALDTATALREKQISEFNEDEKDMIQSIGSLGSAVATLGKHNGASFLQMPEEEAIRLVVDVKRQLHDHRDLLQQVITPGQRRALEVFVQKPDDYFSSQTTLLQQSESYAPQSNQIFGTLSQMKESFETNLAKAQKDEMENQKAYNDLKNAKEKEIATGQDQASRKTEELGDADMKNAESKQDLQDTQTTLDADSKFLADLKTKCANVDKEYQERTQMRQMEIQAVSKSLEFLSSDAAHDLFTRSFNAASFFQRSSNSLGRAKIAEHFAKAAKALHNPRLNALAVRVRLDAFAKVKESIQGMIDKLLKEKEDDIKHKDFCIDALNKNERETAHKDRTKQDQIVKIDQLSMTIDTLSKAIEGLKAEIAASQVEMMKMGEERDKSNREFQTTVADQRATQKLLAAALNVLKGFYEKASLTQTRSEAPAGAPPPADFKKYEKNAASGGIMGMMQGIIDDSKALEAEAVAAEENAQKNYESFVKDTNDAITMASKDITDKTTVKSKAEVEKVETEVQRDETTANLESLEQENSDLHKSCDFLLKNFDLRVTARDEEVEALRQGIAMFSGATFGALMQRYDGPF